MSVINRRNAVMGWLAWSGIKLLAREKARGAVPAVDRETKKPNRSAIALAVVGATTFVVLKLKRTRGELEALDG
ncbi:MAG TPA: hypothetical protein VF094_12985 [Gaiellaceae bacterium]